MRIDAYSSGARREGFKAIGSFNIVASIELIDLIGIVVSDTLTIVLDRAITFTFTT